MDPGFPVVPVGPWTFFAAALDKVQYDYHPHAAQRENIAKKKREMETRWKKGKANKQETKGGVDKKERKKGKKENEEKVEQGNVS